MTRGGGGLGTSVAGGHPPEKGARPQAGSGVSPTQVMDHWKVIETALVKFETAPMSRNHAVKL